MNERDYVGERGETVFEFLIGRRCDGKFWFLPRFLDGKAETKDYTVQLIKPMCGEATFFVQVKATTKGYRGRGAKRKLQVKITAQDIRKLKQLTGPAFVAGIDIELEVGFLLAITSTTPNKQLSGVPCDHPIDCQLIPGLWEEIQEYWAKRNMLTDESLFS